MGHIRMLMRTGVGVVLLFAAVEQADAMSLFSHDHHSGPSQNLVTNNSNNGTSNGGTNGSITANPVTVTPEPSTVVLLASGLVGVGIWRLRQKR